MTQSQVSSTSRIDQVCDQFEKACKAGQPPLIEEILLSAPPGERDRLLGELLEIELDCRQRSGSFLQVEEYCQRFPDSGNLVQSIFRRVVKTRRLGDYELIEELGRGGMGVVFKARQIYLNQVVALKILPHRYLDDSQAVSRFRREMQSIGALSHPNIVRAYNAGESGGVHFLVMEFVDGINLQQFVSISEPPCGPLSVGAACEIIRQAALGLQHASEHQLVHRDIKPANLMLSRNGQVKILDMGLAKFHAEWRNDDQAQGRLTQPGVTMGTIDYMAPEQWENSQSADIRSDIYALGCTLFFLLTGKTPYGDPAFDTSRKKLMAHVVAPIPPLSEHCADCPAELEDVYETMLAKSPADRYATPAELAEALAEFADENELAELIAGLPSSEDWLAMSSTNLPSASADTAKRAGAGSMGSGSRRRTLSRRAARQRFRRKLVFVAFGCLVATITLLLAWVLMPRPDRPPVEPVKAAVSLEPIAADLALLPGLNGPWWFDEIPWFTPFARQAVAARLLASGDPVAVLGDRPQAYLETNTAEAQKWLWEAVNRCRGDLSPGQAKLIDRLKAYADGEGDPAQSPPQILRGMLDEFVAAHRSGDWSAADLHTVALLQHQIASRATDKALGREAKEAYDKALAAYLAERKAPASPRLLCQLDMAFLCSNVLGDSKEGMKEARRQLDAVLEEKNLPALLHVSALVSRGALAAAAATKAKEYDNDSFKLAGQIVKGSPSIKPGHPLVAHVAEAYAWSLMDQWDVDVADKQFQSAYHIRWSNKEEQNAAALTYILHNRHGMAMASRYHGNSSSARRLYATVVEDIRTALAEAERGPGTTVARSYVDELRRRLANSLERQADCELYGGAASKDSEVNLPLASDCYEEARKSVSDWNVIVVMACKQAIVLTLNRKGEAAREILAEIDRQERPVVGTGFERAVLVRQVADAVLALHGPAPADGQKLLRSFLDQFRLNPAYRDSNRRETLELQLFVAELLLASDLKISPTAAADDRKYLDNLLMVFTGRRDMRPFLRRYYELVVRACNPDELVAMAVYLQDSRMVDRPVPPQATLVLFSFTAKEDFAIFLPPDKRLARRFNLDFTRDQVKSTEGLPPRLNDELVSLIKAELVAGRHVEPFWEDTTSRPSGDAAAISEAQWPFDAQLKLSDMRSPAGSGR